MTENSISEKVAWIASAKLVPENAISVLLPSGGLFE
jgi:hypothetical protein